MTFVLLQKLRKLARELFAIKNKFQYSMLLYLTQLAQIARLLFALDFAPRLATHTRFGKIKSLVVYLKIHKKSFIFR